MSEEATIISVTINNLDEIKFTFDVENLLSLDNTESFYTIIGSLERMKHNIVDIINEIESDHSESDDDDEPSDIDKLINGDV